MGTFPSIFIINMFKHTEELKDFYSEYSYTHTLTSTLNTYCSCLIYLSIFPPINPYLWGFFSPFQSKLQTAAYFPLNTSA